MIKKTDDDLIDLVREIISQKGLKVPALAKELGLKYRTLQNYLYKESRMPIWVFLEICARVGITGEYAMRDRFKLDTNVLKEAMIGVMHPVLERIAFDQEMRLSLLEGKKNEYRDMRRNLNVLIHQIEAQYDLLKERQITEPHEND